MSLIYSSLLNTYLDWTEDEIAVGKKFLKWEELTLNWENANFTWDELFLLLEVEQVIKKGGSSPGWKDYVENNPWERLRKDIGEEKTKKVIKLFCKVNGLEYDEEREINDEKIRITVNDFERFVKEGISIKVGVKV